MNVNRNGRDVSKGLMNVLAVSLLVAFIVSAIYAGTTGTVTFSISSTMSLNVPVASIAFGSGSPALSGTTIASNETNTDGWNSNPGGFVVENNGNVGINVTVYANNTAAQFIGGTSPTYKYASSNNETSACTGTLATTWTAMPSSAGTATNVCSTLGFADSADSVKVDIQLFIPADAPVVSSSSSTVTFVAALVS